MNVFEISGFRLVHDDNGQHPYKLLALAEVFVPKIGMHLKEVRLVYSPERGYVTQAPSSQLRPKGPALISWDWDNPAVVDLTERLRELYTYRAGKRAA